MKRIIYSSLSVLTAIGTVFVAAKAEVFTQDGATPETTEQFTALEPTEDLSGFGTSSNVTTKDGLPSLALSNQSRVGSENLLAGGNIKSGNALSANGGNVSPAFSPSGLSASGLGASGTQSKASTGKPGEAVTITSTAAAPAAPVTVVPTAAVSTRAIAPAPSSALSSGMSSTRPYGQFAQVPGTVTPGTVTPDTGLSDTETPTAEPTAKPSTAAPTMDATESEAMESIETPAAPGTTVIPASPTGVSPIPSGILGAPVTIPGAGSSLPAPGVSPVQASPTNIQPVVPAGSAFDDAPVEESSLEQEMPEGDSLMDADATEVDAFDSGASEDGSIEESSMESDPVESDALGEEPIQDESFGEEPTQDESFGEEAPVEDDSFEANPAPGAIEEPGSIEMEIEEAPLPASPASPVPASPDGLGTPVPSEPSAPIPATPGTPTTPGAPIPSAPGAPIPSAPASPVPSQSFPSAPDPSAPAEESLPPINDDFNESDGFSEPAPLSNSGNRLIGEGFTAFQLSYLAASGGLKEAGIPGGGILIEAYKDGDISAEDVVAAGATTQRLGTAASDEADYTKSVDSFLKLLVRDDRTN